MKITKRLLFTITAIILALILTSCGGPKIVSLIPAYRGEEVTDTHHEFSNEDFYVLAVYEDGTQKEAEDFEIEVKGMNAGYYILDVTVDGFTEEAYVPINAKIYPSDFKE